MSGWRPALRIAWRDALRHRGRSALVLVMISLPVLAVSAAAIIIKTSQVEGAEGAERHLGAAAARIHTEGRGPMLQAADPSSGEWGSRGDVDRDDVPTAGELAAVLGGDPRMVPIADGWRAARLGDRVVNFETTGVDLRDPITTGLFDLRTGSLPEAPGEVVVNDAMLAKGFRLGGSLEVDGTTLTIVGVGRDATARDQPKVLGSIDDLPGESTGGSREWLVDSGPVSWSNVRDVNEIGGVVTSRAVLADPPDLASMAEQMGYDTGTNEMVAVVVLIVVMALIEVVLLAGPAFAVGARRHARTLALIAASGGTPAQARRVILGSGVVLGLVASAIGLLLGILAGWALVPLVQRFNGEWFGPFELPWTYLAAIVAFGVVSAVLASVVPAWLASRQDVVAVLAGRRGDRGPRAATPVVGLVLLGAGVAASTFGALTSDNGNGAFWIAAAAIVSVLGMILVVPVLVATIARLSGRLPLTARYAARDAARHRTRTVPAVAAVAATVAGVVALGIANASDELQNEKTYVPQAQMGTGFVSWGPEVLPGEEAPDADEAWSRIEAAVAKAAPAVEVGVLRGPSESSGPDGYTTTSVEVPPAVDEQQWSMDVYGPMVTVADDSRLLVSDPATAEVVDAALADGRAVVFTGSGETAADVRLRQDVWREGMDEGEVEHSEPFAAALVSWDGERLARPRPAPSCPPGSRRTSGSRSSRPACGSAAASLRRRRPGSRSWSRARSTAPTSTSSAATSARPRRSSSCWSWACSAAR